MLNNLCYLFEAALHRTLRHYELLHKDHVTHRIVKRGLKHSNHPYNVIEEVEFQTLGKNFRLILHPHREVLHSQFKAYSIDKDGNETIVHLGKELKLILYAFNRHAWIMISRLQQILQWPSFWCHGLVCSGSSGERRLDDLVHPFTWWNISHWGAISLS